VVIKRELARRGGRALVRTEFVGVSGQVCSVVYELTGPVPQHFTGYAEAERALHAAEPDTAWSEPATWMVDA
jgi:hypothetical protein